MKPIIRNLAMAAILPVVLSACGGGGGGSSNNTPPPPVTSQSFQEKVGANFATVFNASTTADAVDPTAASVPPLDLTANPVDN